MRRNTWNHRVVRHKRSKEEVALGGEEFIYAIHEVHYTDGKATGVTQEPANLYTDSPEELKDLVNKMLTAFEKPVLNYWDF